MTCSNQEIVPPWVKSVTAPPSSATSVYGLIRFDPIWSDHVTTVIAVASVIGASLPPCGMKKEGQGDAIHTTLYDGLQQEVTEQILQQMFDLRSTYHYYLWLEV